jgi:hypothetical protein
LIYFHQFQHLHKALHIAYETAFVLCQSANRCFIHKCTNLFNQRYGQKYCLRNSKDLRMGSESINTNMARLAVCF